MVSTGIDPQLLCVVSTGTGGVGSLNTGHAFSLLLQLKVNCPSLFLHAHMPKGPHPLHCVSDCRYVDHSNDNYT